MQIESLKVFCDIVRLRNFSQAAAENNVTQSMASQTVHNLEQHLNIQMIDRSQRPWKLTPEGQEFYKGCRDVVERYHNLEAAVKKLHNKVSATIRVASIYSVGLRHMGFYIHQYSQLYPWVQVKIDYLNPDRVYESVLNDQVDIGIVSFPRSRRDLEVIPWQEENMVLACYPTHRLARKKRAALSQLANEPFIGFDKNLDIRKEMDRLLKKHGVSTNIILEFDNIEVIKQAVEIGNGVSILPFPTLEKEVKLGTLCSIPLANGKFTRPLGIIHRKGIMFNQNIANFINLLQSRKKTGKY